MKGKNITFRGAAILAVILLLWTGSGLSAQSQTSETVDVPLTDPAKPVMLKVMLQNGDITVKGTNTRTVRVVFKAREIESKWDDKHRLYNKEDKEAVEKARGMKRIRPSGLGLDIEEENNQVEIKSLSFDSAVDLEIQVPVASSMTIKSMQDGDVRVSGISGFLEVGNMTGKVIAEGVSGTVVASAMSDDLTVIFDKVNLDKPMSFVSMSGDLDITFPANLKANVKLQTHQGEIFSDFDIAMKQKPVKVAKDDRKKGGKFKVSFDNTIHGTINGGGKEITFKTFSGNIYIRKKK